MNGNSKHAHFSQNLSMVKSLEAALLLFLILNAPSGSVASSGKLKPPLI